MKLTDMRVNDETQSQSPIQEPTGPVLGDGEGGKREESNTETPLKSPVLVSVGRVGWWVRGWVVYGSLDVGLGGGGGGVRGWEARSGVEASSQEQGAGGGGVGATAAGGCEGETTLSGWCRSEERHGGETVSELL